MTYSKKITTFLKNNFFNILQELKTENKKV
jgi:hypothetical protein